MTPVTAEHKILGNYKILLQIETERLAPMKESALNLAP